MASISKSAVRALFLLGLLAHAVVAWAQGENGAVIFCVEGLTFEKMPTGIFVRDQQVSENQRSYLLDSISSLKLPNADVRHFNWDGNAWNTPDILNNRDATNSLLGQMRQAYQDAQAQGKKFVVVGHSWGTFLATSALLKSTDDGGAKIKADLLVTLSSPLGTDNNEGRYNLVDLSANRIISDFTKDQIARNGLDGKSATGVVDRVVNYWAEGDLISGPTDGLMRQWFPDAKVDQYELCQQTGNACATTVNSTSDWHEFTTLGGTLRGGGSEIASMVRGMVGSDLDSYIQGRPLGVAGQYGGSDSSAGINLADWGLTEDQLRNDPYGSKLQIAKDVLSYLGAEYLDQNLLGPLISVLTEGRDLPWDSLGAAVGGAWALAQQSWTRALRLGQATYDAAWWIYDHSLAAAVLDLLSRKLANPGSPGSAGSRDGSSAGKASTLTGSVVGDVYHPGPAGVASGAQGDQTGGSQSAGKPDTAAPPVEPVPHNADDWRDVNEGPIKYRAPGR